MAQPPPLAALRHAAITFGGRPTVEDASFSVGRGERVALVGRNGSGKSTLLKALAGLIDLDEGERFVQPGAHIAYMPQEPVFDPDATIADHVAGGLLEPGPARQYRVDTILAEVGLDPARRLVGLSGGEGRRVSLARLFVDEPDILLLDEPTNHLDIPAILWLEARLAAWRGAVLLISHDRAFLNRLATRVLWLDRGRVRSLDDGFAGFAAWSLAVLAAEEAEAARLNKKIASETVWLRQGISARRTRNMGRVRALQALREERAQRVTLGNVRMGTAEARTGGQLVVELEHVAKSFPPPDPAGGARPKVIVTDFSTRVLRGDRVGIVGANGAGKSTLLKLMLGELRPDSGKVRHGTNLLPAIFDQHRDGLDDAWTVRENLSEGTGDTIYVQGNPRHVMGYMRDFLFDERQAVQPAGSLSGGERNRLLLAKVLARESNLLVLDEPTNDLDMDTLDLLEDALAAYDGTLFLVSHDRDFLDRLVTSVIAVEGNGEVAEYVGGYTDYLRQRPPRVAPVAAPREAAKVGMARPSVPKPAKLSFGEQHDLKRLPGVIERLAAERASLETALSEPSLYARDPGLFASLSTRLADAISAVDAAEERWLEIEMKREAIEGEAPPLD